MTLTPEEEAVLQLKEQEIRKENSHIRWLLLPWYSPQNPSNDVLDDYVKGDRNVPMIAYGPKGIGKSAALSHYTNHMRHGLGAGYRSLSVHLVNISGRETTVDMLRSLTTLTLTLNLTLTPTLTLTLTLTL